MTNNNDCPKKKQMYFEGPTEIKEDKTRNTANAIADWICNSERLEDGPWVVGIYGERGTGKTSLLLSILEVLKDRNDCNVRLPNYDERGSSLPKTTPLFSPADTRGHDDLLFLLLRHIEEFYGYKDQFKEAYEKEVERKDFKRVLEYEQDVSPSKEKMKENLVKFRRETSTNTKCIQEKLSKALNGGRNGRQFLIFVDDLDLKTERSYELLDIIRLFFYHKGFVILVAADRSLLLRSLEHELKKRNIETYGLAKSMLSKLVPYEWRVPQPDQEERFSFLWEGREHVVPELPNWWSSREECKRNIAPLLPKTYRDIKLFHNRLVLQHELFGVKEAVKRGNKKSADISSSLQDDYFENTRESFVEGLYLPHEWVFPFLSAVIAHEVFTGRSWLSEIESRPDTVVDDFKRLLGKERNAQDLPQDTILTGDPNAQEIDNLRRLALMWDDWRKEAPGARVRKRFLNLSLNINSFERSRDVWEEVYREDQVSRWHLDLREFGEGTRADPEQLRAARSKAKEDLRAMGVASFTGEVELFARAQLPLVCWLGWYLRHMRRVTAYNDFAGQLTGFYGPEDPLSFQDRRSYEILHQEPEDVEPDERAIVLVDLMGKSNFEQTSRFYYYTKFNSNIKDDQPIEGAQVRLAPPTGSDWKFNQDDLVTVLEDVYECIAGLRLRPLVGEIHLGLSCPDVFAFFLGRELNGLGPIHLYEYYDDVPGGRYLHVFKLE